MNYLQWNDALAQWIFSTQRAGAPIFLHLDKQAIESAGQKIRPEVDFDDFLAALQQGVPWDNRRKQGLCERALQAIRAWRKERLERGHEDWPPYLAYLVLFTHAAALDGEFSTGAYYARLRTCLGEGSANGTYAGFKDMEWLWEDLEKWSNVDKRGELGRFRYFLYGKHRHVGPPQAQTLLSHDDRELLPWIFERSEFDPSSPPRETEMLAALLEHGRNHLKVRTRKILENPASEGAKTAREVLATIVLTELREWDGRVNLRFDEPQNEPDFSARHPSARHPSARHPSARHPSARADLARDSSGSLRLCGVWNAVTGSFKASLRCKTPIEFPDDGFWLRGQKSGAKFVAEEWDGGWSYPLRRLPDEDAIEGEIEDELDAATLDWNQGLTLRDAERGWKFRWRAAPVRVLTRDPEAVLDDLIEVFGLPLGREVWILASSAERAAVEEWGKRHAREWNALPARGLPSGWTLFKARAIGESARAEKKVPHPVLTAPSGSSLLLRGGVRATRAARFFDFALPRVEIEGAEDALLFWHELGAAHWLSLQRDADGLFSLPPAIAEKNAVRLSARRGALDENEVPAEEIAALTLYIERDNWDWKAPVEAADAPASRSIAPLALGGLLSVEIEGALIYLGAHPGQVARWPQQPDGWEAVWIVNGKRNRKAIYCAADLALSEPQKTPSGKTERKNLKEWKDELKTTVEAPSDRELRALWKRYLDASKNLRV